MYIPKRYQETRLDIMYDLIRDHPLATLITHNGQSLSANHIPMLLGADDSAFGLLSGHVARANPVWREHQPHIDVLAIFQGSNAYISPSWYTTKKETGRVVPTWNYAAVHVTGSLKFYENTDKLRAHLIKLVNTHESGFPQPWLFSDAPAAYTDKMLTSIIGFELTIRDLKGKWKVGQNQPEANQVSLKRALRSQSRSEYHDLADLLEDRKHQDPK